uniref:Uncharacterized protein n=1 Tax=Cacopsylla melanoneura TaxID=428564 RepID=A0A8D9FJG5_9HEMI
MGSRCKCTCKVSSAMCPRRCNSKWTFSDEGDEEKMSGRRSRVVYRARSNKCQPYCEGDIIVQCQRSWHSESPHRRANKANKKSYNPVKTQMKPKIRLKKNRPDSRALVMHEFNPVRSKRKPAGSVENFYNRFKQEIRKDLAINKKIKQYSESSANKAYDKYLTNTTVSSRILCRSQSEISN